MDDRTGIYLNASTSSPGAPGAASDTRQRYETGPVSNRDKVELWFLRPLKNLRGHDGFVCLMLCLPLLEKVIRHKCPGMPDTATFSHGADWTKELAQILENAPEDAALAFWGMFRNGLAHRAQPKTIEGWSYELTNANKPLRLTGQLWTVNPYRFRDEIVIPLVEANMRAWKDSDYPLARVFSTL